MTALYDPEEHEPLTDTPWNEAAARDFVRGVLCDTDGAFVPERGWPVHPEDRYADQDVAFRGVYCGAAGVMWALCRLAPRYDVVLRNDYAAAIAQCEAAYRSDPVETGVVVPSYFMGTVGIMLARRAILGSAEGNLEPLFEAMRANVGNPTREPLWGSPGTVVAALLLRAETRDARCDDAIRAVHDELWETWETEPGDAFLTWEQDMYGRRARYVGAGHGAFGNIAAFVRAMDLLDEARRAHIRDRVPAMLDAYALRDGDAVNWIAMAAPERFGNRVQWCHGAPGVIISLAAYPRDDERVEALLLAGGRTIRQAGPLGKGPTLCHGTAGNGFALLRLAQRTGDEQWLESARGFAMHAMQQTAEWRRSFGISAFSLWTGELGVACYVDAVLRSDPDMLSLDVM